MSNYYRVTVHADRPEAGLAVAAFDGNGDAVVGGHGGSPFSVLIGQGRGHEAGGQWLICPARNGRRPGEISR